MKPEFPAAPRAPLCPHAFIRSGRCSNKTFGGGGVGLFVCLFLRRGRRFLLGTQAAVKTCAKNKRKIILFKVAERGGRKPRRGPRFGGDLKAVYSASLAKLLHVTVLRGGTGTPPPSQWFCWAVGLCWGVSSSGQQAVKQRVAVHLAQLLAQLGLLGRDGSAVLGGS